MRVFITDACVTVQVLRRSATDACLNSSIFEDDDEEEAMSVLLHSAMLYERYSSISNDSYERHVTRLHSPPPDVDPESKVSDFLFSMNACNHQRTSLAWHCMIGFVSPCFSACASSYSFCVITQLLRALL